MALSAFVCGLVLSTLVFGAPLEKDVQPHNFGSKATTATKSAKPAPLCFPALGFTMPLDLPKDNTDWWCDPATEYAFVGFSYEVTACEFPCEAVFPLD